MRTITVYFKDGTKQGFNSVNGITSTTDQWWLTITDDRGKLIGLVPRENIQYVTTPQDVTA
jgi:hypothetical protein